GQDGFAVLLSCRALSSPTTCRFIPALDVLSVNRTFETQIVLNLSQYCFAVKHPLTAARDYEIAHPLTSRVSSYITRQLPLGIGTTSGTGARRPHRHL